MKRKRIFCMLLIMAMTVFFAAGCGGGSGTDSPEPAKSTEITDLLGRTVEIPADPQRFICIGAGSLRMYCYVADPGKLVGVEALETKEVTGRPYAMAKETLQDLPIIGQGGPGSAPDAEKLLAADPDVIFTMYTADPAAVEELQEKTGKPVVALSYGEKELFDPKVSESIELIGTITGQAKRAKEVTDFFKEAEEDLKARTADIPADKKPAAYMGGMGMRGAHGMESTTGDFVLFEAIGARNAVKEAGIDGYIMIDKEKILEMDPDVIFIDGGGLALTKEDYEKSPAFYQGLKAFKNNRVYMHLPYNYYYTNLEVALADAYYMGKILYPEEFKDVEPEKKFDEITQMLLGAPLYEKMSEAYFGGYQNLKF